MVNKIKWISKLAFTRFSKDNLRQKVKGYWWGKATRTAQTKYYGVFGCYENSEVGDDLFLSKLIKDAGVHLNIKYLKRIWVKTEGKIRLIKVVL